VLLPGRDRFSTSKTLEESSEGEERKVVRLSQVEEVELK